MALPPNYATHDIPFIFYFALWALQIVSGLRLGDDVVIAALHIPIELLIIVARMNMSSHKGDSSLHIVMTTVLTILASLGCRLSTGKALESDLSLMHIVFHIVEDGKGYETKI